MPLQRDKNGKWVVRAGGGDGTAYVPDQPAATAVKSKPKPKPKPRPWWQKVVNDLSYEAKRIQQDPLKAAQTYQRNATQAVVRGTPGGVAELVSNGKPLNNIRYELKQLSNPERVGPRLLQYANRQMGGEHVANTMTLGGIQAAANIARNVLDAGEGDYTDKGGQVIDDTVDEGYRANAQLPPSEMTREQKAGDDARASLVLNLGLGVGTAVVGNALQGTRFLGPAVSALQKAFDPAQAKTLLGGASRVLAGLAVEEALSTPLDDNTGGSAVQLLGLLGLSEERLRELDPVKPGMTRNEASAAAFVPNVIGAGAMVGGLAGASRLLQAMPGVRRARQTEAMRSARQKERDQQLANGLIQEDEGGAMAFTEEALQPPAAKPEAPDAAPEVAPTAPATPADEKAVQASMKLPDIDAKPKYKGPTPEATDADPRVEPWSGEYDSTLPESDALGEVLEEAPDDALLQIAEAEKDIPAVADEVLSRPGDGYDPEARLDLVAAPSDALAEVQDGYSSRLRQVSTDRLLSLASPSNSLELHEVIANQTGKSWDQFTRADVLEGLRQLESQGVAALPNRLMGAPMMRVEDIEVAPERFQFKDNVDAQGQQKGNSLDGVDRWNPDMEGTVQVWEDPADGKAYVVNGHNRLAKAKALGIPSIRVEHLTAASAEDAMAQGALANIGDGKGTPFDAAKFFRSQGIESETDPRLVNKGIPMKSGLTVQGLALSKLPDTLLQQAINGELPLGRALALGGSGLDAEGMIRVNQLAAGRNVSERGFAELVQLAGTAPKVDGAAQGGLPGLDDWMAESAIFEQAEIAAKVRTELISNKNLFGKAAKRSNAAKLQERAGAQIDTGAAASAKEMAAGALAQFDQDKLLAGTRANQLLSKAALEMKNGAKRDVLVRRILREMEADAEVLPPKLPEPQMAPDDTATLPLDVEAADEPTLLTTEQRQALKSQIIAKAAQNGEVRPPSTPLPVMPKDSGVSLDKVAADLEKGEITEDVIKVLDDELRLEEEFKDLDARVETEMIKAEREAMGYDSLTFEQKKSTGMLDGWDAPEAPPSPPPAEIKLIPYADKARAAARFGEFNRGKGRWGITEKQWLATFDRLGGVPDWDAFAGGKEVWERLMQGHENPELVARIKALVAGDQATAPAAAAAIEIPPRVAEQLKQQLDQTFKMPTDLDKSAPRFGMAQLVFESDLDRAAYTLRDGSKKSKGEDQLIAALEAEGYDIAEIRRLGQEVKTRVQDGIEQATGSRRAPQKAMKIEVPASQVEGDSKPGLVVFSKADQMEAVTRDIQSREDEVAALKQQAQTEGC